MQQRHVLGAQRRTLSNQAVSRTNAPVAVTSHKPNVARAAAVQPETIPHSELLDNLFQDMCKHYEIDTLVRIGDSGTGGIGLFAKQDFAKGQTIIKVPRSICIVIDNDTGALTIPQGEWPRLSGGIMQEGEPLTCECCCCCYCRCTACHSSTGSSTSTQINSGSSSHNVQLNCISLFGLPTPESAPCIQTYV
jgi:hypothetical protein